MIQFPSKQFMRNGFPFWIHRRFHSWDRKMDIHCHEFIELVYVVRGQARHEFEGSSYDIRTGDIFIINPGEVHAYSFNTGDEMEIINCLFHLDLIQDSLLLKLDNAESMDFLYVQPFLDENERFHHRLNLSGEQADKILALLEEMIQEINTRPHGYNTMIRLRMMEMLILLSRYYEGTQQYVEEPSIGSQGSLLVRRVCGYLERSYPQKVSLTSLSHSFNISIRHLNRLFKQETGLSVIKHLHRIRIQHAKNLLMDTNLKVSTIASQIGYDDSSFFSVLFTREERITPKEFRERHFKQKQKRSPFTTVKCPDQQ